MVPSGELTPLVAATRTKTLSWLMASLCVVDLFGVFPVIALPRPIIDCGYLGIPIALFVMCIQIYTARLLGKCWLIAEIVDPTIICKNRYPYAAIAELCFGSKVRKFVSFLLNITLFSGGVPNLLVASQLLQLVGLRQSNYGLDISFCYWMLILGVLLCPMMWFGSPKDMKCVAMTSCCTVMTVAALTWTCMIQDTTEIVKPVQPQITWESVAIAYGILAFQFDIHPMILTVQVDMEHKNKLGRSIVTGFTVSGLLFITTTALAMSKYGSSVSHNLLQSLPGTGLLYVTIVLVTLQICLSMVVGGSPLFQDIEDKLNIPREFNWKRCVLRSTLVFSSVMIAEMVPRFDLIMGLMGGALTGPLMFIFPSLFYLKLKSMHADHVTAMTLENHLAEYERALAAREKQPPYNPYLKSDAAPNVSRFKTDYSQLQNASYREIYPNKLYGENELSFEPVLPTAELSHSRSYFGEELMRPTPTSHWFPTRKFLVKSAGLGFFEKTLCFVIIILGVLATVAATYFSLRDTLKYAKLTPPCFP